MHFLRRVLAFWAFPIGAVLLMAGIALDAIRVPPVWGHTGILAGVTLTVVGGAAALLPNADRRGDEVASHRAVRFRVGVAALMWLATSGFALVGAVEGPNALRPVYYACAALMGLCAAGFVFVYARLRSAR